METILATRGDIHFCVSQEFNSVYLCPLADNLKDKFASGKWDDYNEAYHCCQLIHEYSHRPGMTMDFHSMSIAQEYLGLAIMSHGNIDPHMYAASGIHFFEALDAIVLFNYFHISPTARGNGSFWLNEILMPWYASKGYEAMYFKSSHPKAFSLYERIGTCIGAYTVKSDNGLFERPGLIFRVQLHH